MNQHHALYAPKLYTQTTCAINKTTAFHSHKEAVVLQSHSEFLRGRRPTDHAPPTPLSGEPTSEDLLCVWQVPPGVQDVECLPGVSQHTAAVAQLEEEGESGKQQCQGRIWDILKEGSGS